MIAESSSVRPVLKLCKSLHVLGVKLEDACLSFVPCIACKSLLEVARIEAEDALCNSIVSISNVRVMQLSSSAASGVRSPCAGLEECSRAVVQAVVICVSTAEVLQCCRRTLCMKKDLPSEPTLISTLSSKLPL